MECYKFDMILNLIVFKLYVYSILFVVLVLCIIIFVYCIKNVCIFNFENYFYVNVCLYK